MDPLLNLEKNDTHRHDLERAAVERRRRWPDDGLAPRFERTRHRASLHPASVLASLVTRS